MPLPTSTLMIIVILTPLSLGTLIALVYIIRSIRRSRRSDSDREARIQQDVEMRRIHRDIRNIQRADLENQLHRAAAAPVPVPVRFNFTRPRRARLAPPTAESRTNRATRYQARPRGPLNTIPEEELTEIDLGDLTVPIAR
ncbi:hypothetical protein V8F20_000745 [Naviculisporaceae sp. PSN 640]